MLLHATQEQAKGYVFGYINPDTDGVCSSIGYSFLVNSTTRNEYMPVVFGDFNNETIFVLEYFNIEKPQLVSEFPAGVSLAIVDTHHKNQLPANIPFERVKEIIDHHPAGDSSAFPNAKIQNELVGAAATLITERIMSASVNPDYKVAGLLCAAIISNTLNFTAPSTSVRDKVALNWLKKYTNIDEEFIYKMFKARSDILNQATENILTSDYKAFKIGDISLGITQLETIGLSEFIQRPDLIEIITKLKSHYQVDHFFFNGVDIFQKKSTLIAVGTETQRILSDAIGANFNGITAVFSRILLRKTDLIPQLKNYLETI